MLPTAHAPAADAMRFLHVVQQGAALATREDLQRWLAGAVQDLLPHDALLAASGDFGRGDLAIEFVCVRLECAPALSGPSGLLVPVAHALRDGWIAARHAPGPVDLRGLPLPPALLALRGALVHGLREAQAPHERVVALLAREPDFSDREAQSLRLLLPFVDAALRRLPPAVPRPQPRLSGLNGLVPLRLPLSERERQIMTWVALGKTNPEIGCILQISEFTVKNHLKSIFSKLDVSNRAQAVAKLTGLTVHA